MSESVFEELLVRSRYDPVVRRKMVVSPLQFLVNFDLSPLEREVLVLPGFRWILRDELAAMPFPPSEDAYVLLQELGIKAILNLSTYVDDAPQLAAFSVYHLPISDQEAPPLDQIKQAVSIIRTSVKDKQPIAVHCEFGKGRTGTVIAGYLISLGFSAQDAINSVRKLRPGSIETEEQEAVLGEYERLIVKPS